MADDDNLTDPLLEVDALRVVFRGEHGDAPAVREASFVVEAGKTLGLVGESGCGKSVTSLAILGLVEEPGRVDGGSVRLRGRELVGLPEAERRPIRGREIAMIFQEPMTSLNPVYTIGNQLVEAVRVHENVAPGEAISRARAALESVGIPSPELCLRQYPHELSGGMKQRAMIAMALVMRPRLLIADEPTTALDVTVQAQILDLLQALQEETGMGMLFITHDLGVVARIAHQVCVMYAGRIVETGETSALYDEPLHPYTVGLFHSLPALSGPRQRLEPIAGTVPPPGDLPPGCAFHPRCPRATDLCRQQTPPLEAKRPGRLASCHHISPVAVPEGVA